MAGPALAAAACPVRTKNAGADNGADAERHQIERRQGALERHAVMRRQRLHLGFFSFRQQYRKRFAHPDIRHDLPHYSQAAAGHAVAAGKRTFS
jgi:hypothetical protein